MERREIQNIKGSTGTVENRVGKKRSRNKQNGYGIQEWEFLTEIELFSEAQAPQVSSSGDHLVVLAQALTHNLSVVYVVF